MFLAYYFRIGKDCSSWRKVIQTVKWRTLCRRVSFVDLVSQTAQRHRLDLADNKYTVYIFFILFKEIICSDFLVSVLKHDPASQLWQWEISGIQVIRICIMKLNESILSFHVNPDYYICNHAPHLTNYKWIKAEFTYRM